LVKDFIENNDFGQLIIQRSYCKYLKKIKDRTKGGRSRVIPLSQKFCSFLRGQAQGKGPDDLLLWDSFEEGLYNTKFRKHFAKALKETGITRIRVHDLRHTFAVHFLEGEGQLYDLQKLLGHQSLRLTERYSHFSKKMSDRSRGIVEHF